MPKIILVKGVCVNSGDSWSNDTQYELYRTGSEIIRDVTEEEAKALESHVSSFDYDVSVIRVIEEPNTFKQLLELCQEKQKKIEEAKRKEEKEREYQRQIREKNKLKQQQDKEIHERRLFEELKKKYELQSATAFSSVINPLDGSELKTQVVSSKEKCTNCNDTGLVWSGHNGSEECYKCPKKIEGDD